MEPWEWPTYEMWSTPVHSERITGGTFKVRLRYASETMMNGCGNFIDAVQSVLKPPVRGGVSDAARFLARQCWVCLLTVVTQLRTPPEIHMKGLVVV